MSSSISTSLAEQNLKPRLSEEDAEKPAPSVRETNSDANMDAAAERNFNLKSLKFWAIILSTYAALFLVALDRLIIATAIPSITNSFHSIEDIAWYGSAYMLPTAVFFPLCGRLYQLYSTKWLFLASIFVFEIGSAVCGAAPSSSALLAGRAIAGTGSAGIFCGSTMIFIPLVPLRKRPVFTGFSGLIFGIASIAGPFIGGAFTDTRSLTWRWCFYINLPIGGVVAAAVFFLLHVESPKHEPLSMVNHFKRLDPLGLLFFVPSMVCLILALQWGGTKYSWSAPTMIALLVVFAITFIIFIVIETLMPETAMAPPRVVFNRSVGSSMVIMLLISGSMMSVIYYITTWFQVAQGTSAFQSGIRTLAIQMSFLLFAIPTAVGIQKIGYYNPSFFVSAILCAVGAGMLSTLTPDSGKNQWIGYQVIFGFGIGAGFQNCNLVPQTVLPHADISLGIALVFFMQQIGGAVFLAVGQNLFTRQLVSDLANIAGLDTDAIINTGATSLRKLVPANELGAVVKGYSYALTRTFLMAAVLSACIIIPTLAMEWKSIKEEKKGDASGGTGIDLEEAKTAEKV